MELLTPVHIGSGVQLYENIDYFIQYDKEAESNYIGVIDSKKVCEAIGEDNIPRWVQAIERGDNLFKFIKTLNKNVLPETITRRIIFTWDTKDTIKECMQTITPDGRGKDRPIIPGSSIKGAIRTALLATSIEAANPLTEISKGKRVSSSDIEKKVFNEKDLKESFMKSLRVGDALFLPEDTYAYMASSLNYRVSREDMYDKKLDGLIEAIPEESSASFNIAIDPEKLQAIRCGTIKQLFERINIHTQKLLKEELEICNTEFSEVHDSHLVNYIEWIKKLLRNINHIIEQKQETCILRIGYGSGWRFITGAWTEQRPDFESIVVPASRFRPHEHEGYVFPKTRRLSLDDGPFGFVKLSIR